jgi:hypothetical protein
MKEYTRKQLGFRFLLITLLLLSVIIIAFTIALAPRVRYGSIVVAFDVLGILGLFIIIVYLVGARSILKNITELLAGAANYRRNTVSVKQQKKVKPNVVQKSRPKYSEPLGSSFTEHYNK